MVICSPDFSKRHPRCSCKFPLIPQIAVTLFSPFARPEASGIASQAAFAENNSKLDGPPGRVIVTSREIVVPR
jgi:hypothetical protein